VPPYSITTQDIQHLNCLVGVKSIPDRSVDLIVTDPPYEIEDLTPYFQEMNRILKPTGSLYCFGDKNMIAEHWFSQLKMPYKQLLVWYYKNSPKPKGRWRMSMQGIIYGYTDESVFHEDEARVEYLPSTKKLNGRTRPSSGRMKTSKPYDTSKGALPRDVLEYPALLGHLSKERVGHPDQKPLQMIETIIKTSSNPGDLVVDFFCGSGTTLVAAKNTKRNAIGFEVQERWVNTVKERLNGVV
jgi:site-specific DNA-methyltransferase (adenine-specific)